MDATKTLWAPFFGTSDAKEAVQDNPNIFTSLTLLKSRVLSSRNSLACRHDASAMASAVAEEQAETDS